MGLILNWLDILWFPAVFVFAGRRHWVTGNVLVLVTILTLRLQVELMTEIGYPNGFLPLLSMPVLYRGFIIYGFFLFIFLLLSSFSKRENSYIYIAAAIGIFIISFCITAAVMFL